MGGFGRSRKNRTLAPRTVVEFGRPSFSPPAQRVFESREPDTPVSPSTQIESVRPMHILLFVPDNHVTRNFVPQLWPFLLRARTPAGHRVTIIDGNARAAEHRRARPVHQGPRRGPARHGVHDADGAAGVRHRAGRSCRDDDSDRVRRPARDRLPDEALGRTGLPRTADAVVLGEADEIWAEVVEDAARGALKDVYGPDGDGHEAWPD